MAAWLDFARIGIIPEMLIHMIFNQLLKYMTRYFITFCHFPTPTNYYTGWVTSSNDEGNFVSDQYIIDYLNAKYPIKTSKIEIIESVEITETEFNRFNLITDTKD